MGLVGTGLTVGGPGGTQAVVVVVAGRMPLERTAGTLGVVAGGSLGLAPADHTDSARAAFPSSRTDC